MSILEINYLAACQARLDLEFPFGLKENRFQEKGGGKRREK